MRAYIPDYQLLTPKSLADVLTMLDREPETWKPFAGGTDLMVLLESGKLPHRNYVDIWNLHELRGVSSSDSHVTLGALTTYTEVQSHDLLRREFPMLCQAASETGGLAIQNRGTLGGNIVNASPAADSPPALLVYDAELELTSQTGSRWVPYYSFHTGYKQMNLLPNELLTKIRLRRTGQDVHHYYRKVGTRKAQAISKVCFAATARLRGKSLDEVRIALGSVAPIPLRCSKTENKLRGKELDQSLIAAAVAELRREIKPIDDIRSTLNYRLRVSQNLLVDFLNRIVQATGAN
jgi:CO/xanthine dehydrogenase FAD-binding subunit